MSSRIFRFFQILDLFADQFLLVGPLQPVDDPLAAPARVETCTATLAPEFMSWAF